MDHSALLVNSRELAKAFKTLRKFVERRDEPQIVLTFEDDCLTINATGVAIKVAGQGSLRGQAYLYWRTLVGVATIPPTDDPVIIKIENGRLIIGTSSLACQWQESILNLIELPMDAPLRTVLGLRAKYTDEQIARSALVESLWEAERRRDELIIQASKLLEPLGVEYSDLVQLVKESFERTTR